MITKRIIFPVLSVVLGLIAGVCIIAGTIFIHVKWAEAFGHDATPLVRNSRIAAWLFSNESYYRIIAAARAGPKFRTVADFDQSIALQKRLFVPTEMYGSLKYRYRPNIGIYNCRIWSGLRFKSRVLRRSNKITTLLKETVHDCIRFRTDENGFKPSISPVHDGSNIFFLGDSFTEGLWTSPKNTFVSRVGRKLRSRGLSANPINLAVSGYSALEMSWMLERYAPLFSPKIVIVNLFLNDVHDDFDSVLTGVNIPDENYKMMFDYLNRIADYCIVHDIVVLIAVIPTKSQFSEFRQFHVFQDRVKMWAEERQLRFLDPREYFDKVGSNDVYLSWDPHFSIEGHKKYADYLAAHIADVIRSN